METQAEIYEHIEKLIPADLWAKYSHLSFIEMAEKPDLADYADELREAEKAWFAAE